MILDPSMNDGYGTELSEAETLRSLDRGLRSDDALQEPSAYVLPAVQPAPPSRTRKMVKKPSRQKRQVEYIWDSTSGRFELDAPPQPEVASQPLPQPRILRTGD